jgi:hypothetical protein
VDLMARRRLGLFALAIGLAIVVAAQQLAPIGGPPLYDGVIVEAPYVWLSPPAGFPGGAQGVEQTIPVQGGQNPDIGIGTSENPPQAQFFAGAGYLNLPAGTTSIKVSIEPVAPASLPDGWAIAGNVYRFSVTNQAGQPLTGQASGGVTIELRGPATLNAPGIEHFSGGKWSELAADSVGQPNIFTATVTDFGDFALVEPAGWTPDPQVVGGQYGPPAPAVTAAAVPPAFQPEDQSSGLPWPLIALAALAIAILVVIGVGLVLRRRRVRSPASGRPRGRMRTLPPPARPAPLRRKQRSRTRR